MHDVCVSLLQLLAKKRRQKSGNRAEGEQQWSELWGGYRDAIAHTVRVDILAFCSAGNHRHHIEGCACSNDRRIRRVGGADRLPSVGGRMHI